MRSFLRRVFAPNWRPGRAALVGLAATAAYSVAMETDKFVTGNQFDDVKFIQGLIGDSHATSKRAAALAWLIHFGNGVMLGEVYAALFMRLLPGPRWLKGIFFGEAFVLSAWAFVPLVDRYHPLVKDGQLPRLGSWQSFWQNLVRHLFFGLTLGLLYREPSSEDCLRK